jgi:hypothetical protein
MADDIVAQVHAEMEPKSIREIMLLLAVDVKQTRQEVGEIKALYNAQGATVAVNCNRLTHLETMAKVGKAIVTTIVTAVVAVLVKVWTE